MYILILGRKRSGDVGDRNEAGSVTATQNDARGSQVLQYMPSISVKLIASSLSLQTTQYILLHSSLRIISVLETFAFAFSCRSRYWFLDLYVWAMHR